MRALVIVLALVLGAVAAFAQGQQNTEQLVRTTAQSLAQAQSMILSLPDLMTQRDQALAQVKTLQEELAKLRAAPGQGEPK